MICEYGSVKKIQIFPGHYEIGYITYNIYVLALGVEPTLLGIALGVFFGLIPDLDVFLLLPDIIRRDKSKSLGSDFKHHAYPTHYPLLYSPLIVLAVFLPNIFTLSLVTAIYLHFFVDTFYTSDGIKWLYPFKNKFYLLRSEKTRGKHGIFWEKEYVKTPLYKLEFVLLVVGVLILWLNHIFYYMTPSWSIALLGGAILCFFVGAFFIERAHVRYIERKATEEKEKL